MVSCDLTTESQSTFDDKSVFSDPTLTEYQLFSIYEVFGHTNSHRARYLPWYGYNTDIEWYISNTQDDKAQIAQYAVNVFVQNMFPQLAAQMQQQQAQQAAQQAQAQAQQQMQAQVQIQAQQQQQARQRAQQQARPLTDAAARSVMAGTTPAV